MKPIAAIVASLLAACSVAAQAPTSSRPRTIDDAVGTVSTLCGTVTAYRCLMADKMTLLDIDSAPAISVAIAQADRALFEIRPEAQYLRRRICATGAVTRDPSGGPYRVQVANPADIRAESAPPADAPKYDPGIYSPCDPGVNLPRVQKDAKPQYTSAAMSAKIHGAVLLDAIVTIEGRPDDIRVIRSLDPEYGLDREAVKAVEQWRFAPGTLYGRPVPVRITVQLTFTLR